MPLTTYRQRYNELVDKSSELTVVYIREGRVPCHIFRDASHSSSYSGIIETDDGGTYEVLNKPTLESVVVRFEQLFGKDIIHESAVKQP